MPSKTEAYVARKFKFIISYHKRSRVEGLQEQCFQWFNNAIKNPCSWLIHTVVQQKLTQHCKAIILKKKKKSSFFFCLLWSSVCIPSSWFPHGHQMATTAPRIMSKLQWRRTFPSIRSFLETRKASSPKFPSRPPLAAQWPQLGYLLLLTNL